MSTYPRWPEFFPHMKHRAKGREIRKANRRIIAAIRNMPEAKWTEVTAAFRAVGEAAEQGAEVLRVFYAPLGTVPPLNHDITSSPQEPES